MAIDIPLRNPAADYYKYEFNDFTKDLYNRIQAGAQVLVRLRDERIVELTWQEEDEDEGCEAGFHFRRGDTWLIWEKDGISITSFDFDIIERVSTL